MTTESKSPTGPTTRGAKAWGGTASGDTTKDYSEGGGTIVVIDNRLNADDCVVTLTERADPISERVTDPATYNPVTVPGGSVYYLGPYSSRLYGQGTGDQDLIFSLACSGSLATPANLAIVGQAAGGSLADATYYYQVTAVNASGGETLPSTEANGTVAGGAGSGSCDLTWDAVDGAVCYNVYGRAVSGTLHYLFTVVNTMLYGKGVGTVTDTGDTTEGVRVVPVANTADDDENHVWTDAIRT